MPLHHHITRHPLFPWASAVFCPEVWGIRLLCAGQEELLLAPGSCQRACPEHRHPWQHHWGWGSQKGIHCSRLQLVHKAARRVRWLQGAGGKESKGGEKAEGEQEEGGTGGKWREPEEQEKGGKEGWEWMEARTDIKKKRWQEGGKEGRKDGRKDGWEHRWMHGRKQG